MAEKVNGKKVEVKPVSARVYFDIQEQHDTDRAINMAIMAASIVDEQGNPAFTEDTIQDLDLPTFQKLQRKVTQANAYDEEAEKN